MLNLKLCAFMCLFVCALSQNYEEREEQGYPTGLMSVCPGSDKPATIPKSQLKYLHFIVHGRRSRRKYTYWNAKSIIKDPRINFKRKTMIFAPGYLDSANLPISRIFAKLYHELGFNVILLDYQRFASVHYYLYCGRRRFNRRSYAAKTKRDFPLTYSGDGDIHLKKNHNFYYQIQGQLHISRKSKCYLICFIDLSTPITMVVVERDEEFIKGMVDKSTRLMRPVGKHIAQVLAQLTNAGLDPSTIELLGFSLGGQSISYIAKNYQQLVGRNISRITALDPAGPCYRWLGKDDRLAPSDADLVQVIHTNMDAYGMAARMGHIDFYVNGGEFQTSDLNLYLCTSTCSHFRVLGLWVSALRNPGKFIGLKCDSIQDARDSNCYDRPLVTNVMGLEVDGSKPGIFYLSTGKWFPYFLGEKGVDAKYAYWRQVSNINDGNETEIFTT